MATPARLTALTSAVLAVSLALSVPVGGQSGIAALLGWLGLIFLVFGLLSGVPGAIAAAAIAFVLQQVILAGLSSGNAFPLWLDTVLLVLVVETATLSLSFRERPSDVALVVTRSLGMAVVAGAVVEAMALVLAGNEAQGVLLRAAGVAALMMVGGWVVLIWRRAGAG